MSEKLYVLGHPVSHSKSPVMYNAVYEKAGLPWHYGLMDVPTAPEAEAFLAARDFLSINITTPYKPRRSLPPMCGPPRPRSPTGPTCS